MFRRSLAAVFGVALALSPGLMSHPTPVPRAAVSAKKKRGLFNDMVFPEGEARFGRKGAGITMAQQKRAARKKSNQARHKAAVKR